MTAEDKTAELSEFERRRIEQRCEKKLKKEREQLKAEEQERMAAYKKGLLTSTASIKKDDFGFQSGMLNKDRGKSIMPIKRPLQPFTPSYGSKEQEIGLGF